MEVLFEKPNAREGGGGKVIEVNMTRLEVESTEFGFLAVIWLANAFGYWASDSSGPESNYIPHATALMRLLRELKKNNFLHIDDPAEKSLTKVVENWDVDSLYRAVLWPDDPRFALGIRWKNGQCKVKRIKI